MSSGVDLTQSLSVMLRALKLPGIAAHYAEVSGQAERQGWSFMQFLHHLCELELTERKRRSPLSAPR